MMMAGWLEITRVDDSLRLGEGAHVLVLTIVIAIAVVWTGFALGEWVRLRFLRHSLTFRPLWKWIPAISMAVVLLNVLSLEMGYDVDVPNDPPVLLITLIIGMHALAWLILLGLLSPLTRYGIGLSSKNNHHSASDDEKT